MTRRLLCGIITVESEKENMKCELCKIREATNHTKNLYICDHCWTEIQIFSSYYIGDKEVTKENYDKVVKKGVI